MTLYIIPSLIAIIAKLFLLWIARRNFAENLVFTALLGALLVMNAVEFSSYFITNDMLNDYVWLMQLYFLSALVATATITDLCLVITGLAQPLWRQINALLTVTVALLTIVPGTVIAGVEPMGEFVRRIPGPALPVWTTYVVLAIAASVGLLLRGVRRAPSRHQQRQSCALALAFLPGLLSAGLIVVLMSFGYRVNGAVTMSIMSTLLAVVFFLSESRYHLFRLLSAIPSTVEYQTNRRVQTLVNKLKYIASMPDRQSELKAILAELEQASIAMAIDANDGNVSKTARAMKVSRNTILRKRQSTASPTNK